MKNRFHRFIGAAAILYGLALVSCGPKDDVKASEAEVDRFHERWNQSYFTAVYNDAHTDFRVAKPPQQTIAMLQHNRSFFGTLKSATQQSAKITWEHSEKNITLNYECVYEHGKAAEVFGYRITDGKPLLAKYFMTPETGK
jgi:hypothetical protein